VVVSGSDLSPIVNDTQMTSFVFFSQWEVPKSFFLTKKFVLSFMIITFLIMILPVIILVALHTQILSEDRNSDICFNFELQVCFVEFAILFIICFTAYFLSRRLKVVQEHLGIKSELKKSAYAIFFMLCLSMPNIVTSRWPERFLLERTGIQFYQILDLVLPVAWIIYQSFFRIAYRATFGFKDKYVQVSSDTAIEFLNLLNSPSGFLLFQEYMIQQLRVEDLLFWKDIERWRAKEVDGLTIFEIYVDNDSPLHVELNPFTRAAIRWFFKNGDGDYIQEQKEVESRLQTAKTDFTSLHAENVFDFAYIQVFHRMLNQNFRIFRHSEPYKSWIWLRTRNT